MLTQYILVCIYINTAVSELPTRTYQSISHIINYANNCFPSSSILRVAVTTPSNKVLKFQYLGEVLIKIKYKPIMHFCLFCYLTQQDISLLNFFLSRKSAFWNIFSNKVETKKPSSPRHCNRQKKLHMVYIYLFLSTEVLILLYLGSIKI